jgi:hypothetical protein
MLYQIKCFLLKHQFFGVFTTTQLCALFQDVLQKAMLLVFTVTKILFKITKRKKLGILGTFVSFQRNIVCAKAICIYMLMIIIRSHVV